ncbi:MAG TPA: PQQ-binding-like beta-propeller repeat protein [Gemmataceae bacterium]|nr:PQQ-binding-like beta-propeller repeat protein [Gemmataceae bacterium]
MLCCPHLRRGLSVLATLVVSGAVLAVIIWSGRPGDAGAQADQAKAEGARSWPMFGGTLSRNLVNTIDRNIPSEFSVEEGNYKNIKWAVDLGSKAYGGPVIAGGKIFIGTNNNNPRNPKITGDKGIIMCFRESDGKFLWQAVHDKLPAGRVNDWPEEGICSTPFVEGNRLYYVSNRCELVCADTEGFANGNQGVQDEKYKSDIDADIIWRLDMIRELNVFPHNLAVCSPLIVGDLIFVVTANGVDEGHINIPQPKAPSFIAVDKNTGKVRWTSNLPSVKLVEAQESGKPVDIEKLKNQGLILMHGQWSNPVYAVANGRPQIIFPGGDGWLYSFEPQTGKLIWKFDCNPKNSFYVLGPRATRNDFVATPVIVDNKLYIGVGQDPEHSEGVGHLWCIDITKQGDVSPVNDNFDPKAPENKNSALVWHYGGFGDPKKIGRPYYFGRTMSTCCVHDGLLYVGELGGYFHCLDAKTGQKYWEHNMEAPIWTSPYYVDGKVYMGNDKGVLYVFQHGKEKKILNEIQMEGNIRATPVACNGVLYVMTENVTKLYAITNKK